ncbi:MAG TPA: hypothetical protein VFV28_01620 [Limnobacter sp.]|nr:hypothetical protein [Limnobacter sp.]
MTKYSRLLAISLLGALLTAGCGTRGLVNSRLQQDPTAVPTRILVAPADFIINEIGFGKDQERVVAWENQASRVFEETVQELSDKEGRFKVVDFNSLSQEDRDLILQHRALFATMAGQLLQIKDGQVDVWRKKQQNFQYTLGDGLKGIQARENIQAIVFVVGKDTVRSTARIVADMVNSLLPGAEALSASNAFLVVGLANMSTGEIMSFDTDVAKRKSLSNRDDLKDMANNALTDYKALLRKMPKAGGN